MGVFVPLQKYHKSYHKESLCQIAWVYLKIHTLVNKSMAKSDDYLKFPLGVLLASFSLFRTTLRKVPRSRYNLEMISFNLVPRNLINIKVTRKDISGDSAHRL